jgi:hypothetical protein
LIVEGIAGVRLDPSRFDRYVLFRKRLALEHVPARAPARITADSRYVLFVNGDEVSRGPIRSQPRKLHYDVIDIAGRLVPGDNVIAVLARFYGHPRPWWMPARPTFTLGGGCLAFEGDVDGTWVVSDHTWRAIPAEAWSAASPQGVGGAMPELFDARRHPTDWAQARFDDTDWPAATELDVMHPGATGRHEPPSEPYGALLPNPLPPMRERIRTPIGMRIDTVAGGETMDDPVAQVDADDASSPDGDIALVTVDFGEVVSGHVGIEVDAEPGARFDVSLADDLDADGRLQRGLQYAGFRYVARGVADRYETFDPMGGRVAKVAVRGRGRVTGAWTRERVYPRPAGPSFRCSDTRLDRVYDIGLRTIELTSQDAYVSDATREQRAWTGDAVVYALVDLATNPDIRLLRRHLELTASPRADGMLPMAVAGEAEASEATSIVDWPLHWLHALHAYHRHTADWELVAALLPVAENLLRWFVPYQSADGLLHNVAGWVLIDWASLYTADTSATLNALWARGLCELAEMASSLGDEGRVRWARERHGIVASAFERFWDGRRGLYVDQIVDDVPRPAASQHANATAIVAGLVPDDRVDGIVDRITDRATLVRRSWTMETIARGGDPSGLLALISGPPPPDWDSKRVVMEAQPFYRYVVHDAFAAAGRADALLRSLEDWCAWADAGHKTWPESWFGGSPCHGWSSIPTRDLISYVLGIQPAEHGYSTALIAPRLGTLAWAEGTAATPHGFIAVRAEGDGIEVSSPVPVRIVPRSGRGADLPPGRHHVGGGAA